MYAKRGGNRLEVRKSGFLAGTLSLYPALQKGGKEELSHKVMREKVRAMLRTWERFALRKAIGFKLFVVLSDWSESEQKQSDLHVHFLFYTTAKDLSRNFFADWWSNNRLGGLSFRGKGYGQVVILDEWKAKHKDLRLPINAGWLDYLWGNYQHSKHKNLWQLASNKNLEVTNWDGLGLADTVEVFSFFDFDAVAATTEVTP